MRNNLYTRSYFIKRLKDQKYFVQPLLTYTDDIRQWTILIEPSKYDILCTCYKENSKNFWFKFDCQQKSNIIIKTMSMKTIYECIDDLIDGHKKYNELKNVP